MYKFILGTHLMSEGTKFYLFFQKMFWLMMHWEEIQADEVFL